MGAFGRWYNRLTVDDTAADATELSHDVEKQAGCQRAAGCSRGEKVAVVGRLRAVDLHPTEATASLAAELWDGTDAVELIWLGRRSIPGIVTGRTVKAQGRIALRDGRKVIYNPDYELMPAHA